MTDSPLSLDSSFVFVHGPAASVAFPQAPRGWRMVAATPRWRLFLPLGSRLPVRPLGRAGLLIGNYYGDPAAALRDGCVDPGRLLEMGWGRYVAFWEDSGALSVMRDPSGALDLLTWRVGSLDCAASDLFAEFDGLRPSECEVNWPVLSHILRYPAVSQRRTALTGLTTVEPGRLAWSATGETEQIWSPGRFARGDGDTNPLAFRRIVDDAVGVLIGRHARFVGEISGGFDSAVVATSAARHKPCAETPWINFHSDEAESDERSYARDVATIAGYALTERAKIPTPLDMEAFLPLVAGVRPAFQGLDVEYDSAVARLMKASGATALLTGQGGDAVFFQSGSPALVVDRVRRRGITGLSPRFLLETARWTRWSAWSLAGIGLRELAGRRQLAVASESAIRADEVMGADDHPWLADLEDLPPAKRGQLRQLVNCQVFNGDCLRARAGELLHPLLTQPVMEHALSIPADVLTDGGVDRALARKAFADRLPTSVRERRGKGELSTYYGRVVCASLPVFRPLLLEGLLVSRGLLDRRELERWLTPETLIWSGDYNRVLIRVLMEVWARAWTHRLATPPPILFGAASGPPDARRARSGRAGAGR